MNEIEQKSNSVFLRKIEEINDAIHKKIVTYNEIVPVSGIKIAYLKQILNDSKSISPRPINAVHDYVKKKKEDNSIDRYGSYTRESVKELEGEYQLIRSSFNNDGKITATKFSIFWSDSISALEFKQEKMPGSKFPWDTKGAIAHFQSHPIYHFIVTDNRKGRHNITTLRHDINTGLLSGLSVNVNPTDLWPIAIPVILIPWKDSLKLQSTFGDEHNSYSDYKNLIINSHTYKASTMTMSAASVKV